jgi:hypothetical protein
MFLADLVYLIFVQDVSYLVDSFHLRKNILKVAISPLASPYNSTMKETSSSAYYINSRAQCVYRQFFDSTSSGGGGQIVKYEHKIYIMVQSSMSETSEVR